MSIIKCPECGKEISDKATFCPNCGVPLNEDKKNVENDDKKNEKKSVRKRDSTLSILAAIFAIFVCTLPVAIILAIIDVSLPKKENERHIGSWFALIVGIIFIIATVVSKNNDNETVSENNIVSTEQSNSTDSEVVSEDITTEEVTEISSDDFKASCQDFDYNTIARNPEDYVGQNFVVTVKIFDVISESSWFSDYDKYYKAWTDDGSGWYMDHMIYLVDYQDENSSEHLNILEGDVVKVYGTFNGMIPTTNSLNGTNSEEIGLDIKYAELISE